MDNFEPVSDWDLIEGCKQGNHRAWKELVERHRRSIALSIRERLGDQARDRHLVEDLVQDVLVAMIHGKYKRLRRYHWHESCFDTYLKAIATQIVQQWHRSQHRRIEREVALEGHEPSEPGGAALAQAELAEYLNGLTPQEARYLRENLLEMPGPSSAAPITQGNEWVLRHRLKKKWKDHFE